MSAIVAIVALFAALATPSFLARQRTREVTAFFVRLPDLAVYARETAQRDERIVRIRYDDGQSAFLVELDGQEAEDDPESLTQLNVPSDLEVTSFRQEEESVSGGEWELVFYPDGRSDGGGVEVNDNGRIRSVVVAPDGVVRLQQGTLPTIEERRWQAGEREQRL